MNLPTYLLASVLALSANNALARTALSDMHPEEAYPDNLPPMTLPGPYTPFIKEVQQKLRDAGFDAGPVNGDFGTKTQAALAQFQLSQTLPASGMLDEQTLRALGVPPPEQQTDAGASSSAASGSD
jgi:peptidoglycan hydrolase-like protein with peptidoglycan-binding domain